MTDILLNSMHFVIIFDIWLQHRSFEYQSIIGHIKLGSVGAIYISLQEQFIVLKCRHTHTFCHSGRPVQS